MNLIYLLNTFTANLFIQIETQANKNIKNNKENGIHSYTALVNSSCLNFVRRNLLVII